MRKLQYNSNVKSVVHDGASTIAVTESGTYRMRILIKEYKGTTLLSEREFYKNLDKNGY